jgi:2,3-dihydro-2,3-dihydroxybenzoate dehydrogenase
MMTAHTFAGQVALVTGAASGIGRAIAIALAEAGAHVVALDKDREQLARLGAQLGTRVQLACADVTRADEIARAVREAEAARPIGLLVYAAGVLTPGELLSPSLDVEALRRAYAVHVEGLWLVLRAVAAPMQARGSGAIVAITSNAASTPRVGLGAYAASKAAAAMLMRCLALELAPDGVRCNTISPGSTDTPMLDQLLGDADRSAVLAGDPARFRVGIPLGRIATPDDIAQAALFLLSPAARHITAHDLRVDGGATW